MENLGEKDKESLEDNGIVLIESYSVELFVQISSQNCEANVTHPTGETKQYNLTKQSIGYAQA